MARSFALLARLAAVPLGVALAACDGNPDEGSPTPVPPVSCSSASATPTMSVLISGMEFLPYCVIVGSGRKLNVSGANELTADLLGYALVLLAHGARVQDGRFSSLSDEGDSVIGQPEPGTAA